MVVRTLLKSRPTSLAMPKVTCLESVPELEPLLTNSALLFPSQQKPRSRTRLTCWIVPSVTTSVLNCFSPCRRPSSFLTATGVPSGSAPLNTVPKLPLPSFSEKSLVASSSSSDPCTAVTLPLLRRIRNTAATATTVTRLAKSSTTAATTLPRITIDFFHECSVDDAGTSEWVKHRSGEARIALAILIRRVGFHVDELAVPHEALRSVVNAVQEQSTRQVCAHALSFPAPAGASTEPFGSRTVYGSARNPSPGCRLTQPPAAFSSLHSSDDRGSKPAGHRHSGLVVLLQTPKGPHEPYTSHASWGNEQKRIHFPAVSLHCRRRICPFTSSMKLPTAPGSRSR
uniref:Uncharacterized protein n=1 Tax=Oryza meridionalis TaxID=40149 RepID=A0A0E0CL29_9ORYZ